MLSGVGKTVDFSYERNPINAQGKKSLSPRLAQKMEGWRKEDSPIKKKFPVGVDVPEFLTDLGVAKNSPEEVKAVGEYALIILYCLLQLGGYTFKGKINDMKQTVQFKLEDAIFFFVKLMAVCANYQPVCSMRIF